MSGKLRPVLAPLVVAAPAGMRVRTRLRVSEQDAAVLRAVGSHLGSLAGRDLRARCAEGRLDAKVWAVSRRERKRQLTAGSSSRWAGSITRTSEHQVRLAERNLTAEQRSLRARIAPSLAHLRQAPILAADLNHGHLAAWIITPDGNPHGPPVTVPLELAGLPAPHRDGRLRAAVSELIRLARARGCRAIAVEDLNFAAARTEGRELSGNRPARGKRGKAFRRTVAGIPTARFRDRLVQMAANQGLAVIAVDPAYTSRWAAEHWLAPLREHNTVTTSGHHAAAVVIGRRAQGHRARRRAGVTGTDQRISRRRATPRVPQATRAGRNGGTARPHGSHPGGPRPCRPTGNTRPTRQPTTVRGRRIARTIPCYLNRNGTRSYRRA